MADPFLGEIIMFGGNFAPRGWAHCDGQLVAISQYSALFSILGTSFGGDGRTTFGLPDLRGRVPMHPGSGPGLSPRRLGEKGGAETHTLNVNQLPPHSHAAAARCSNQQGNMADPTGNYPAADGTGNTADYQSAANGDMNSAAVLIGNTGGNQAHNNVQPYQCVNFIIALVGIFPSRN